MRYFTLFFIPLFPLGKLSEYVECQVCRRTYQYQPEFLSPNSTDGIVDGMGNALNVAPVRATEVDAQTTPNSKPWIAPTLIIIGGLAFLLGCVVTAGAIFAQYNFPGDSEGFIAFIVLCPVPVTFAGIIMLTIGLFQSRKGQIEER